MKKILFSTFASAVLVTPLFAGSVVFDNGGFEAGNASGWTLNSGKWEADGSENLSNAYQSESTVMTNPNATDSRTNDNLKTVLAGDNSFRLNNPANGAHYSTLTQTVTNYGSADLYFGFAAILENPSNPHTEEQTPKFSFNLHDATTNTSLYSISFDSRDASTHGIAWNAGLDVPSNTSTWMYTDWNIVHIDSSAVMGHTLVLQVVAYDCALGGHGGYAYIDAFQFDPIVPNAGVTVNHIEGSSLTSVPETSTWVMGLLAIGAVGFIVRRKSSVVA